MNDRWKLKAKPASMDARFEFTSFETLRTFLDELAEKADSLDHHPNISFARTHVSVIIYSEDQELNAKDHALAEAIDECFDHVMNNSEGVLV